MKWIVCFLALCLIALPGCSLRKREMELTKKIARVNEREQQLNLKEQFLAFREQQLDERAKLLDSTTKKIANDSLTALHPLLPGMWAVKMVATETNCAGSAVGDTKNEQWKFSFQNNNIIARAISNNKLVRIYTGSYTGNSNSIKLTLQQDTTTPVPARMTIRLQSIQDKEMEGEREIIQQNGCRIVYSLQLKKI